MAWNPTPKVADCRDLAKKWDKHQIIVLAVNTDECTLEAVSFGATKELCADAKRLADACYQTVYKCYEEDIETMKNPNGPSIEELDDMADARADQERAELSRIAGQLRTLHQQAEAAAWSAVDDGRGDGAFKTETMEAFNVAAWNHLPFILDKLDQSQKSEAALAINAGAALKFAKRVNEDLRRRQALGIECAEECDQWREVATALAESCKLVRHGTPGMGEALRNYEALLHQNTERSNRADEASNLKPE